MLACAALQLARVLVGACMLWGGAVRVMSVPGVGVAAIKSVVGRFVCRPVACMVLYFGILYYIEVIDEPVS